MLAPLGGTADRATCAVLQRWAAGSCYLLPHGVHSGLKGVGQSTLDRRMRMHSHWPARESKQVERTTVASIGDGAAAAARVMLAVGEPAFVSSIELMSM